MKPLYLISLFSFLIPLFSGCALLQQTNHDSELEDPIELAARQSQRLTPEQLEELEDRQRFHHEQIERGRNYGDIVLGMGTHDVVQAWGEPRDVETAGDPRHGNQRWVYYDGISSRWGLGSSRTVYFENGKVVGWQRDR